MEDETLKSYVGTYNDSILDTVKKTVGIPSDVTDFDQDILIDINSVLSILTQIGIGPEEGYVISDHSQTWKDFLGEDPNLEMVKSYICCRVRLIFDPPANSNVTQALEKQCTEFETRASYVYELRKLKTSK